MSKRPHLWNAAPMSILVGVMLLAVFLRIRGLGAESAWWDEYASVSFLHLPTLGEFLRSNRTLDPASMPLYFVLEYFWAEYVDASLYGLRLLSVLFGVLTVPVVYRLGSRLGGAWAGGIASILLTLSPIHIHHSQGIRMYALFVFLATCSYWLFVENQLRSSTKTWAGYALVSCLLYWTHPFALLVPLTQALWFLPRSVDRFKPLMKWMSLHFALILPVTAYLARLQFWPKETTASWMHLPSLPEWLGDVFWDDIVAFGWQLRSGSFTQPLGPMRPILDAATAVFVLLALVLWVRWWWNAREEQRGGGEKQRYAFFLFSWLLIPPLALYLLSLGWRPCIFPRYTTYAPLALYLVAGALIAEIPKRRTRILWTTLAVSAMLLQYLHTLPEPQRTNWISAAKVIERNSGPADAVLVENPLWRDVFRFNAEYAAKVRWGMPVAAAATPELLAAQTKLLLSDMKNDSGGVWIVTMRDYFDEMPPKELFKELEAFEAVYHYFRFPAICAVYVVYVRGGVSGVGETGVQELIRGLQERGKGSAREIGHATMQAIGDLATETALQGRAAFAISILRELIKESSFAAKVYGNLLAALISEEKVRETAGAVKYLWEAYGYRDNGFHVEAARAFARAVKHDPDHALAWLELGLEQIQLQELGSGVEALKEAIRLDEEYDPIFSRLLLALERHEKIDASLAAALAFRDGLGEIAAGRLQEAVVALEAARTADPELFAAMNSLGYVFTLLGEYERAQTMLKGYLTAINRPDPGALANLAIIQIVREQPEKAWQLLEKAFQADPKFAERFRQLFEALLIQKDYDAVMKHLERLQDEGIYLPPALRNHIENKRTTEPYLRDTEK